MENTKVDSNIMSYNNPKEELTKITASKYDPSLIRHSYITCNWINQSPASLSMLASKLFSSVLTIRTCVTFRFNRSRQGPLAQLVRATGS